MERLEVSGAVRPIYGSLGVKRLTTLPADKVCGVGGRWMNEYGTLVQSYCPVRVPRGPK